MAKKRLASGYTFDASAQTIVHADFSDITLEGIQLIVNVTDNIIIYNFADATKGGSLSTDTLTLTYNTTTMDDGDKLMILVEDGVATQGVTGTVTANAGTNLNTSALALEAGGNLATIAGAVSGTEMQVDVLSIPTITVNSHAVTNAGTFAVQVDGSALTALQLIDDTVYTDGSGTPSKGILALGSDGTNPQAIITDVTGHLQVDVLTAPTTAVTGTFWQATQPVSFTGSGDVATQTTLAAINAKLVTGTDIGDVTINNSTGVAAVNIQDGGNTITVDGTVAVTNADLTTIAGAVSETHMQADVLTMPGTGVEDAGETVGGTLVMVGAVRRDTAASSSGTTGDNSTINTDANGNLWVTLGTKLDSTNDSITAISGTAANLKAQVSVASGGIASGAIASGAIASGAIASGALAAGSIAVGAITAGDTSIATTEDTASAAGEHIVKIGERRIDTAASSAGSSNDWATPNQSAEGASWATLTPTTTSGCTIFRSIDLDESEEEVKATAGNVYGYYFANTNAAARYLKFYNATAANTTVGTTTPVMTMYLPPTSAGHVGFSFPAGFATAITVAATTGVADNDTGAPGANEVIVNIWYK